ncbi:Transmembrane protein 97 [Phlyctochytrium planicorne]|nr:Transmembrane protein 97 [Phlyctochytrium planicorne]
MPSSSSASSKPRSRPLTSRPLDILFLFYFVIHIPITLLVDIQPLSPATLHPQPIKQALADYIAVTGDFLMEQKPNNPWFLSILTLELLFQFPFFFVAAHYIWHDRLKEIRTLSIAYCAHVLTTMVPICWEFAVSGKRQTELQRTLVFAVYGPWVLIPLLFLWRLTLGFEKDAPVKEKTKKQA